MPRKVKVPAPAPVETMPIVLIEWLDACIDDKFEGARADVVPLSVANHTVGFLEKETDEEYTLVTDATIRDDTVRTPYGIPKAMVLRKVVLSKNWAAKCKRPEKD